MTASVPQLHRGPTDQLQATRPTERGQSLFWRRRTEPYAVVALSWARPLSLAVGALLMTTLRPGHGAVAGLGEADDLIAFCRPPLAGAMSSCICSVEQVEVPIMPEALHDAGCHVVLNGRGADGDAATERLARRGDVGRRVGYVAADLRERGVAASLLAACEALAGTTPDILVNNAGIQHVAPVQDFPEERWDEVVGLNLSAAFYLTRAALPAMRRRGWGRIVNIASVHGLVASEGKCAYVAAKHGLLGLTKVVALETANDGVTCNAICPGWVRTALVEAQVERIAAAQGILAEEAASELLRAKQPMRRFSTSQGIGALVVFLCGEAAATMTGAALTMDGGWVSA